MPPQSQNPSIQKLLEAENKAKDIVKKARDGLSFPSFFAFFLLMIYVQPRP